MNSFCAWYSLRMSFCSVPPIAARGTPVASALATNIANTIAAGPLIVIDVVTVAEIDAPVQVLDVGEGVDGDTALPDLAERERVVGVAAHQGRQIERGREAVAAGREQIVEAAIGVDRGSEPREHPHRPQLRPVHRGVRAARVRVLAGELAVVRAVDRLDRNARHGGEVGLAVRVRRRSRPASVRGCWSRLHDRARRRPRSGSSRGLRRPGRHYPPH